MSHLAVSINHDVTDKSHVIVKQYDNVLFPKQTTQNINIYIYIYIYPNITLCCKIWAVTWVMSPMSDFHISNSIINALFSLFENVYEHVLMPIIN